MNDLQLLLNTLFTDVNKQYDQNRVILWTNFETGYVNIVPRI